MCPAVFLSPGCTKVFIQILRKCEFLRGVFFSFVPFPLTFSSFWCSPQCNVISVVLAFVYHIDFLNIEICVQLALFNYLAGRTHTKAVLLGHPSAFEREVRCCFQRTRRLSFCSCLSVSSLQRCAHVWFLSAFGIVVWYLSLIMRLLLILELEAFGQLLLYCVWCLDWWSLCVNEAPLIVQPTRTWHVFLILLPGKLLVEHVMHARDVR